MTTPSQSSPSAPRRRLLQGTGVLAGSGLLALAGTGPASAADTENGVFFTIGPTRIFDSRSGDPRIHAGTTTLVPAVGFAGDSFFVNLTVVHTVGAGYLTLYDADLSQRPTTSSINWNRPETVVANLAVVNLGQKGFNIHAGGTSDATTDLVIDLVGYVTAITPSPTEQAKQKRLNRQFSRLNPGYPGH